MLSLTERDYLLVLKAALDLSMTAEYRFLVTGISGLLDFTPRVDTDLLHQLHTINNGGTR